MTKWKKSGLNLKAVRYSTCAGCRTALEKKEFAIIYKDVVECQKCGFVWILPEELLRKYA